MEIAEIKFPMEYFKKIPRNEYGNVQYAWIREVLQNSLDAHASEIRIVIDNGYITVVDNGKGMNYNTLTNAFLSLGGSEKESGSVGGFGKAKEIELFTWDEWSIKTSTGKEAWFVSNEHIGKKPIESITPNFRGTIIKIKSDTEYDDATWKYRIRNYIKTCTTNCKIFVNEDQIKTLNMRGKKIELDWADVIYNKSRDTSEIYVRIGGITMFEKYNSSLKGTVIIDITKPSTEILTSNRESFKYTYSPKYDRLIEEITIDTKSAFRNKKNTVIENYVGKNIFSYIKKVKEEIEKGDVETSPELKQEIKEAKDVDDLIKIRDRLIEQVQIQSVHSTNLSIAAKINDYIDNYYEDEHINRSVMGFEFFVMRNENKKPKLDPNSRKCQTILNFTKNILVKLVEKFNINQEISIGLLYITDEEEKDVQARMLTYEGKKYLLINPDAILSMKHDSLGAQLYQHITHELTHLICTYHNEEFTSLWTTYLLYYAENIREWHEIFRTSKAEVKKAFYEV